MNDVRLQRENAAQLLLSSSSSEVDRKSRIPPKRRKKETVENGSVSNKKSTPCKSRPKMDASQKMIEKLRQLEKLRNNPNHEEIFHTFGPLPKDSRLFNGYTFLVSSSKILNLIFNFFLAFFLFSLNVSRVNASEVKQIYFLNIFSYVIFCSFVCLPSI